MTKETTRSHEINLKVLDLWNKDQTSYFNIRLIPHVITLMLSLLGIYYFGQVSYCYFYPENPSAYDLYKIFSNQIATPIMLIIQTVYFLMYYFQFPIIEQYKTNSAPWPWVEDKPKWKATLFQTLKVWFFNEFVIFPIIFYLMLHIFPPISSLSAMPSFFEFLCHGLIMVLIEDFFFYWAHRCFHLPFFYKWIHKTHHSHQSVINISNSYAHWIEYAVENSFCMLAGMILLKGQLHAATLNSIIIFRVLAGNEEHSGYDFPWSPFKIFEFSTSSAYHNYHHLKNSGNFCEVFTLWDSIFKTNADFYEEVKKAKLE